MAQLSAISSELESVATRSALDSLRKALAEGGGANGRGSGSGRLNRLFDQLHEPRPVMGEAAHVARGGELDGRRPSALGHEPLQGRVEARSWPETAYHDGSTCQAAGPDGMPKMPR